MSSDVNYTAAQIEAMADEIRPPVVGTALTEAQRKVLKEVLKGSNTREMAAVLGISEKTVKAHVSVLLSKFKCDSRARLIAKHYRGELK